MNCPAATGITGEGVAHQCHLQRGHERDGVYEHRCGCGSQWFSMQGSMDEYLAFMNRRPEGDT